MEPALKRTAVRERIKDATRKFQQEIEAEKSVTSIHPRIKEIKEAIDDCPIDAAKCYIIGVIAAVTGIPPELIGAAERIPIPHPLVALVLTGNPNSHDYKLGQVVVYGNAVGKCIKPDGQWGNCIPRDKEAIRTASSAEIETVTDAQLDKVSEFLIFA